MAAIFTRYFTPGCISSSSSELLQKSFLRSGLLYKKIEWFSEYFMPASTRFVNGPPLPEIENEENQLEPYRNAFKTVTVRNAALTSHYMHNGVYKSLEEVVDFYNRGGGAGLGLTVNNH